MSKELKIAAVWVVIIAAAIGVLAVNKAGGVVEPVGEVYTATYSYCGQYAGVGGTRHCSLWLRGTEKRQDTRIRGKFFDINSYTVVR